jgi:hypothetical protein
MAEYASNVKIGSGRLLSSLFNMLAASKTLQMCSLAFVDEKEEAAEDEEGAQAEELITTDERSEKRNRREAAKSSIRVVPFSWPTCQGVHPLQSQARDCGVPRDTEDALPVLGKQPKITRGDGCKQRSGDLDLSRPSALM